MTKGMIQPLESYRLAAYAMPIPCYICQGDNTYDSEFCRHCLAPMALAHQANSQKVCPQMLAVIGASGAGKTVYLGMLMDMLSRQSSSLQLLARGAFSITLQQTALAALSRGRFPDKTPNEPDRWNWVHCQIRGPRQKTPLELIMPDMAGDALFQEIDHPHSFRVIREFLDKCAGALVLIDGMKLHEGRLEQDYFTMKLVSYLHELGEGRASWSHKPVALVFTKADQCESLLVDPEACARNDAARLWQQCRERFRKHRFFAARVAGACAWAEGPGRARTLVPLRIEPHGIVEPFAWLLEQILGRRWAV